MSELEWMGGIFQVWDGGGQREGILITLNFTEFRIRNTIHPRKEEGKL
jgi:hypothetical protein